MVRDILKVLLTRTNLDRAVVNQEAVQLLEGLASAIRPAEDDIGDTAALGVRAVHEFDSLDVANRLDEVFLKSVSQSSVWSGTWRPQRRSFESYPSRPSRKEASQRRAVSGEQ